MATREQIADGLAIFSANYLKRWLDGNLYDRILQSDLGQKLKSLDTKAKYGIEFGLNLLSIFFDQALAEDTAVKRLVKEVGLDAAPEISVRLLNHAKTTEEQELVHALLAMNQEELVKLLAWLYEIDAKRRKKALREIGKLSVEELTSLARMSSEDREKLLGLFVPARKPWLSSEDVQGIERATEALRGFRARLRAKRQGGQNHE